MRSQCVRRAPGRSALRMPGRALDTNRFPPCAPLCSSECSREGARPSRGIPWGRVRGEWGQRGSPRGPLLAIGARAIGPGGRVGGRMTSAAGWTIKARAEPRIQSAPSRRCAALGLASASQPGQPAPRPPTRPPALPPVCAPTPHRHHAPLPAAGLRPAPHATLAPALRGQARGGAEGGCCCGDVETVRGCMGGLGVEEDAARKRGQRGREGGPLF